MKKTLLLLVAVFAFGFTQAQEIKGGIKGGLNLSSVDTDGASNRTGFHAGLYLDAGLAGFNIMPEVLFSSKGAEFDGGGEFNLTYVEIPVLFKKGFAKVLNVHLGPQFGLLLSAEDQDGNDLKEGLKGSDLSGVIGAGVDLPGGLSGGVRYVLGLSDINDIDGASESIKNKTIQVYIGYKLFGN